MDNKTLCEICHKNDSTLTYIEIVEDKKRIVHICEDCAQKQGLHDPKIIAESPEQPVKKTDYTIDLLIKAIDQKLHNKTDVKICSYCKWSFNDFKKKGKFGCPECYHSFWAEIEPLIKELQHDIRHTGKNPIKLTIADMNIKDTFVDRINHLKEELKLAVETESFERAAELRDLINKMTNEFDLKNEDLK